jgi:hypothetical protein
VVLAVEELETLLQQIGLLVLEQLPKVLRGGQVVTTFQGGMELVVEVVVLAQSVHLLLVLVVLVVQVWRHQLQEHS